MPVERRSKEIEFSSSVSTEMALLACMVLRSEVIPTVMAEIPSDNVFYDQTNQKIYKAIISLYEEGVEVDVITLADKLRSPEYDFKDSSVYLTEVMDCFHDSARVTEYCKILTKKSIARTLVNSIREAYEKADNNESVDEVVKALEVGLGAAEKAQSDLSILQGEKLEVVYYEELNARKTATKLGTGFMNIDRKLATGFAPGEVSLIAGRPRVGKSVFSLAVCDNLSKIGRGSAYFSLEMDVARQQMDRLVAREAFISINDLLDIKNWPEDDPRKDKVIEAVEKIKKKPIYFVDQRSMRLRELIGITKRIMDRATVPIEVVFIDLFERLVDVNESDSPYVIDRKLDEVRSFAQKLNVNFCLVAHISRKSEDDKRKERRPELKHLRRSGAYEQSSDLVMLLHREKLYNHELVEDLMDVYVDKQRQGDIFHEVLLYDGSISTFLEHHIKQD